MSSISYEVFSGPEISDDIIRQYLEINSTVYPEFTYGRIDFQKLRNRLNEDKYVKLVIARQDLKLTGWLMVSYSEKQNIHHFNMLVHDNFHRRGIGSKMLYMGKELFDELHGVLVPVNTYKRKDGKPYPSPLNFYLKNGFTLTGRKFVEYDNIELVEIKWSKN
jgi:ribosomal protein S18 acetylase RimI-like enzyme